MRYLLAILCLLIGFVAGAQQHAYLVYSVTGSVQVNNAGKTTTAQKGQWLDGKEKITLTQNAAVTLVCQSYKPVIIAKKGTYTLSAFADSCKHTESFSTAYFHYVWEEFSHEHKSVEEDRHHYMKNYGAAVRGSSCTNPVDKSLAVINYYNLRFYLVWSGRDSNQATLQFYERDKKIATVTTTTSYCRLDSVAMKMAKPGKYYWAITPKGQRECRLYELNIIDKKEFDALSASFKTSVSALTDDKAEQDFMLGFMYEEQHYFANAWYCYNQASAANPGQESYRATLVAFEKQYGLAGKD